MSVEEAKKVAASFGGASFVPPPPTINDITAILDQQQLTKPEAAARQRADEAPPATTDPAILTEFYFQRGLAAREIGRARQEIEDLTRALEHSPWASPHVILYELALAEESAGNFSRAVEYLRRSNEAVTSNEWGRGGGLLTNYNAILITNNATLTVDYAALGDLRAAERTLAEASWAFDAKLRQLKVPLGGIPAPPPPVPVAGYDALMSLAEGTVLEAKGHYAEAEALYRRSLAVLAADPFWERDTGVDLRHYFIARNLSRQGRLVEAEQEARSALLGALAKRGRYSPHTAYMLRSLVDVLLEQGRYGEAERLARAVVDIYDKTQVSRDSLFFALAREQLARALAFQRRDHEALAEYEAIRADLSADPESLDRRFGGNVGYAGALLRTGQVDRAVEILGEELSKSRGRLGENPAVIRGYLAEAYAAKGDTARAFAEFGQAMPLLLARAADVVDDAETPRAGDQRLVDFLGTYIGVLADIRGTALERHSGTDAAAEAFRLADVARGRSVQRALNASAARAAARSPALADLVRRDQDAKQQLSGLDRTLANQLSQSTDRQDARVVTELRSRIDALRRARAALATQITRDFPAYDELTHPKPVTVDQVRATLRAGEALVATLVTRERTFVWAVPQSGPVAFASSPIGAQQMETTVATLRRALEPRANTLGDIPDFDVTLAHRLYAAVLEPVQSGWQDAQSLFFVAHGPLGHLPVAVLPTSGATLPGESGAIFSNYRTVPWLVRTHAVTMLPTVASLTTLRALPAGDPSRHAFVGFGDPYFSRDQAAAAQTEETQPRDRVAFVTRAMPITLRSSPPAFGSVKLASLPRLPETAEEIHALAQAMNADPGRDVFLGARANEETVKTLDLSAYRVIAFATHGLVPGDLDGLTQPALALSAPDVAGVDGDGLLQMDEILALRLDADWIVLSACNTASGHGAGSEAISGLGRAFFYAGARALLVSNWPVETTSARALITELFRRQTGRTGVGRAKVLQQTMNAPIDRGEFGDANTGKVGFSYAHPIFWAPFTLIGDGGGATWER